MGNKVVMVVVGIWWGNGGELGCDGELGLVRL